jgi:quercetin dioxygenase-like cupin family protein
LFCYHKKIKKVETAKGIIVQELGAGEKMSVLHWNMADKSVVPTHNHPAEQFGYVIKGGFEMMIGDEKATLRQGDAYFIPPNIPHSFVTVGETEAIDVFHPVRKDLPWKKK